MDFQIGKYMKVDKRLNYFRRNIEAGFMQSCSKSRSTLLPALSTTWLLMNFGCEKSGRRSFHSRREFLKVHTGDTSKYWQVSCYRKVKPSRELLKLPSLHLEHIYNIVRSCWQTSHKSTSQVSLLQQRASGASFVGRRTFSKIQHIACLLVMKHVRRGKPIHTSCPN